MFGMSFATLMTVITLVEQYGPTAWSLAEKWGPLAVKAGKALAPVVQDELKSGRLQEVGADTKSKVLALLKGFGMQLTPNDHRQVEGMISDAEQRFARRADGTDETGQPKFGF